MTDYQIQPVDLEPLDLGDYIHTKLDDDWLATMHHNAQQIASIFAITPQLIGEVSSTNRALSEEAISAWQEELRASIVRSIRTSAARTHAFPQPIRLLRKCQHRRIAARKRRYLAHRERVQAAIQQRIQKEQSS